MKNTIFAGNWELGNNHLLHFSQHSQLFSQCCCICMFTSFRKALWNFKRRIMKRKGIDFSSNSRRPVSFCQCANHIFYRWNRGTFGQGCWGKQRTSPGSIQLPWPEWVAKNKKILALRTYSAVTSACVLYTIWTSLAFRLFPFTVLQYCIVLLSVKRRKHYSIPAKTAASCTKVSHQ